MLLFVNYLCDKYVTLDRLLDVYKRQPYRYVKEYQFVYRWFSLCIFSGTKYMVIKDFRLFCNLTPDIAHVYMDNDFILFYSERKNNSKEDCWSLFDISWSDYYLFFIKPH